MEDVRGCSYVGPALGTENNLREPPPPISFWNVDFGPRIPHTPESPTTLVACLVTSVAGHLVAITHWGGARGARLVLVIQRGPAAQAPVSCGDFLTVLRPPDASGCGNHAPAQLDEQDLPIRCTRLPQPPFFLPANCTPLGLLFAEGWT